MVHSRAVTPAREKTPSRDSGSVPQFCALTGLPLAEVSCPQSGAYLPATRDANGNKHPHIFCTKSGNFLGDFCPITGKNKAHATTKCGKLIAKTWDSEKKKIIPHKYCTQSGNNLKAISDPGPGPRASSPTKTSSITKAKSSAGSGHSAPAPRSPVKHAVTNKPAAKPATKKGRAGKPASTAASCRPTRTKTQTVRLVDEATASHPAVKKREVPKNKAAAKTGAGVRKPPAKKTAPKKAAAAATPKKAAAKKPAAKKPAAKKTPVKKAAAKKPAGVKKPAAKPKANTKKKVVPKKK